MSEFNNVTIVREANVYFNGGVTSRTLRFADGTVKTLGFMQPGEYHFDTGDAEMMEILSGNLQAQLPGSPDWLPLSGGQSFNVPANSAFSVRVGSPTDYCCSFIR